MLEVRNVSKRFGGTRAVDDVSFTLEGPGAIGLLGPNGSGKTTTLRLLAGFFPPSRGTILMDGVPVIGPQSVAARIGYLPENPPLYPEMPVDSYLHFTARLRGLDRKTARERVKLVMEQLSLTDRAGSLLRHLSRGYRQRVGIAQAIVHAPDHVILDEPTSGLDPIQIEETRQLIATLATRATVILSTHLLHEVNLICQRVLVLRQGKLAGEFSLKDLTPQTRATGRGPVSDVRTRLEKVKDLVVKSVTEVTGRAGHWTAEFQTPADGGLEAAAAALTKAPLCLHSLERVGDNLERRYAQMQAGEN